MAETFKIIKFSTQIWFDFKISMLLLINAEEPMVGSGYLHITWPSPPPTADGCRSASYDDRLRGQLRYYRGKALTTNLIVNSSIGL